MRVIHTLYKQYKNVSMLAYHKSHELHKHITHFMDKMLLSRQQICINWGPQLHMKNIIKLLPFGTNELTPCL